MSGKSLKDGAPSFGAGLSSDDGAASVSALRASIPDAIGPWEVEHSDGYGDIAGWTIWEPNGSGYTVAVVISDVPLLADVAEAHARLIAAAPELLRELQALVTAVRFADPPKMFNGVECHEARVPVAFIEGAERAIAKAEAV